MKNACFQHTVNNASAALHCTKPSLYRVCETFEHVKHKSGCVLFAALVFCFNQHPFRVATHLYAGAPPGVGGSLAQFGREQAGAAERTRNH